MVLLRIGLIFWWTERGFAQKRKNAVQIYSAPRLVLVYDIHLDPFAVPLTQCLCKHTDLLGDLSLSADDLAHIRLSCFQLVGYVVTLDSLGDGHLIGKLNKVGNDVGKSVHFAFAVSKGACQREGASFG